MPGGYCSMPAAADLLAQLQREFMAALYGKRGSVAGCVRADTLAAGRRVDVYRNNLRANFHNVLALEFPVIQQLCGAEYFEQLALEFQDAQPSRRGNLHHIGAAFAAWLAGRMHGTQYEWFAGVAALEWAWQECYVAAESAGTADLSQLAGLTPAQQEALRFVITPACRVLQSQWPVWSIWRAHQPGAADDTIALEDIDLGSGECVLVLRDSQGMRLQRLSAPEATVLQALIAGQPLGTALESAVPPDQHFDPGAALQRAAALGLFTDLLITR